MGERSVYKWEAGGAQAERVFRRRGGFPSSRLGPPSPSEGRCPLFPPPLAALPACLSLNQGAARRGTAASSKDAISGESCLLSETNFGFPNPLSLPLRLLQRRNDGALCGEWRVFRMRLRRPQCRVVGNFEGRKSPPPICTSGREGTSWVERTGHLEGLSPTGRNLSPKHPLRGRHDLTVGRL